MASIADTAKTDLEDYLVMIQSLKKPGFHEIISFPGLKGSKLELTDNPFLRLLRMQDGLLVLLRRHAKETPEHSYKIIDIVVSAGSGNGCD